MMFHRKPAAIAAIAILLAAQPGVAAEIELTPKHIENLGIELAAPQAAERSQGGTQATATVEVDPNRAFFVGPLHAGVISRLEVMPGDRVQQGQVLGQIRSTAFLELQQAFIEAAIHRQLLKSQLQRDQSLFADGTVSKRRLQETQAKAKAAAADFRTHYQMLRLAGLRDDEIDALADTQNLTDVLHLRAPTNGVVLAVSAEVGEPVDALAPVYHLADPAILWLAIRLPVEQAADVSPGTLVQLTGALSGVTAVVTAVGQAVDPATQMVRVRSRIETGTQRVRPGQFTTVNLSAATDQTPDTLLWRVPTSAVVRGDAGDVVFIASGNGFVTAGVTVLGEDQGWTYVTGPLSASRRIAVAGLTSLKALWLEQTAEQG